MTTDKPPRVVIIGAGGLEVALAMAGRPFYLKMPKVWGVKLFGELPAWVSAKDIILEMLRRHDVHGSIGKIIEYYGPGLTHLTAMDRHVIANMGAELGATTTVFPSDEAEGDLPGLHRVFGQSGVARFCRCRLDDCGQTDTRPRFL